MKQLVATSLMVALACTSAEEPGTDAGPSLPAAHPFDFEGKRREKTGNFYDANKPKQEKTPLMLARGPKFGGAADPLLNFLLGYTWAN